MVYRSADYTVPCFVGYVESYCVCDGWFWYMCGGYMVTLFMKQTTRTVTHPVIVLLIDGIIVPTNYIQMCRGPSGTPLQTSEGPCLSLYITYGCNVCFNVIFRCYIPPSTCMISVPIARPFADVLAQLWSPSLVVRLQTLRHTQLQRCVVSQSKLVHRVRFPVCCVAHVLLRHGKRCFYSRCTLRPCSKLPLFPTRRVRKCSCLVFQFLNFAIYFIYLFFRFKLFKCPCYKKSFDHNELWSGWMHPELS